MFIIALTYGEPGDFGPPLGEIKNSGALSWSGFNVLSSGPTSEAPELLQPLKKSATAACDFAQLDDSTID